MEKMRTAIAAIFVLMMTLSMIMVFAPVAAVKVPYPPLVEWVPGGREVHDSLMGNPEWLKVWTVTHVSHDTWIHVLGKDAYGQDVEGKAFIPASTPPQTEIPLIDVHSGQKVVFSSITAIYQQGGEHCNIFQIQTLPEYMQTWLGTYHKTTGYSPRPGFPEPSNPDPLKVAINWVDKAPFDGQPTLDECTAPLVDSTITIKGLDQKGNVLEKDVLITTMDKIVYVDMPDHTWSTVCTIDGGDIGISYYLFTHPAPQRAIFNYKIQVHHISVTAEPKNILADGLSTSTIKITLLDIDDNEVHWSTEAGVKPVEINVAATGGRVYPSLGIEIVGCNTYAVTHLTSDTNPRIVRVSAVAFCPEAPGCGPLQLTGEDIVCFDGINSVPYAGAMKIQDIGGTGSGRHYAVFRRLEKGCNLISIPVIPDETLTWDMLPCASQCLKSVATYQGGVWLYYDFETGVGDIIPIIDGWAYWVKAEKPCTLVISGRNMDQYDRATGFGLPPMYTMLMGWNFVGVTSTSTMKTADYLESLHDMGFGEKLWGPVYVYRYSAGWIRNPTTVYPTEGLWLFTYDGILAP